MLTDAAPRCPEPLAWLNSGERLVYSGFAAKVCFLHRLDGALVLTNQRLVFTNRGQTSVIFNHDLRSIVPTISSRGSTIRSFWVRSFSRNSMRISKHSGHSQSYVISDIDGWIGLIQWAQAQLP